MYTSRRTYLVLLGFALVVMATAIGAWAYTENKRVASVAEGTLTSQQQSTYTSERFGYSIAYPSIYRVQQIAPEFITIGSSQGGSLEGVANVAVLYAQKTTPLPSFESFLRLSAGLACSQRGTGASSGSVQCSSVTQAGPFTSDAGAQGEKLYYDSNTGKRGPFYAFDISRNVGGGQIAVLIVYPPPSLARGDADAALLLSIAKSLRIMPR